MNSIGYGKQIQLFTVRFVAAIVLKIGMEQILYKTVGKQVFLNLVIYRLLYKFVFQRIIYPVIAIKVPTWFAQIILLFIFITSRITIVGEKELERIKKEKQRVIFVFWHGDYTLLLFSFRMKNAVALVHSSFRGDLMAQLASVFGYYIVRISRYQRSIMSFIRAIKEGYPGFIAVDGPLGPSHETKAGVIRIARKSGANIIPLALQARRGLLLNRWDSHCIPLPFNNITVFIGKPIVVRDGDSLQLKREEVTSSLLKLTQID